MASIKNEVQRVIVMRHGARLDTANPSWEKNEGKERPYDTPLTEAGKVQAYEVAAERYKNKGITMVISSPFLRCLQTAQEACNALGLPGVTISNAVCEVLSPGSKMKVAPEVPQQDLTPHGITVLQHDSNPMPSFPEKISDAIERYLTSIPRIADQQYPNNILIVTHQYGVEQAVTLALGTSRSYENISCEINVFCKASYCGHVVLVRDCIHGEWRLESKYRVDQYENLLN